MQVGLVVSTAIAKTLQWPVQTLSQMYGSSVFTGIHISNTGNITTHAYICTYIHIYMCVYVYVRIFVHSIIQ